MPSSQTPNYGLSRWALDDKVLMSDFNADNTKIDAALKAEADTRANAIQTEASARSVGLQEAANARAAMAATLATRGNCRIVYGAYTGSGLAGESGPNTLTFDGKPIAVLVLPTAGGGAPLRMILLRGSPLAYSCASDPGSGLAVSWGGNSVSWYSPSGNTIYQFSKPFTYAYAALLAADE